MLLGDRVLAELGVGLRLEPGLDRYPPGLPGEDAVGAALRPPVDPRILRLAQEALQRGRPASPSPNRSTGQPATVVVASVPSMLNASTHSKTILETTPSSPRLGHIAWKWSGSESSRVTSSTSPRPSTRRKPQTLSLAVNSTEPPEEPVAVKPLTVWWV